MKQKNLYIITVLLLFQLTAAAMGQGIVISGSKENTPASVDIINISDSDRQVKTLSVILESRPGINVTRYGTAGSYSSIYVRGTNANQLSVYIDCIPLSDSVFGEVNFENIPLDSIERIEIYKNFAPLCFASPGIGGVVNLVTKKDRNTTETGTALSAGSFNTYKISLFRSYSEDPLNFLISGSLMSGRGNFTFANNNGTGFNSDDDFSDKRKNNQFINGNATARLSYHDGNTSIDVLSDFFAKRQGTASYNNTASEATLSSIHSLNNIRVTFSKISGIPLSEQFTVFSNLRRDVFDDLGSEIGFLAEKNTGTYLTCGAGSYTTLSMNKIFQELSLSVHGQNEYYYLKNETAADKKSFPPQKRGSLRAGIQDEFSILNGRIVITPQVRCEARRDSFSGQTAPKQTIYTFDPQIGAVFHPMDDLLFIKCSYGMNHRAPAFSELFGNRGTVQGNRNLKDENSESFDTTAGITYGDFSSGIIQSFSLEYSYFRTTIKNIIIFMQNSQNTMRADNISAASISGHELTAGLIALEHIDLSCNMTLQYAKDRSDISYYKGNYLPNRPVLEGSSTLKVFNKTGSISYQYSYAGGNFKDRANSGSLYIRERVYHNLTAVWTPRFDLTVALDARNIADNRTEDVAGYPLPGRSFTGSVQYIF